MSNVAHKKGKLNVTTSLKVKGSVEVKIIRNGEDVTQRTHNDIGVEFAYELATLAIFGVGGVAQGQYQTTFSLPQGLVVLLLNNGQVVAQLVGTIQQFVDNIVSGEENTTFGIMGSDNTPAQYTFNELQLWTVVNNALQIMISSATLTQSVTKGVQDIVQVQWTVTATSGVSFSQFANNALGDCMTTCSTPSQCQFSTGYKMVKPLCQSSVLNFLFALIAVPQLQKVLSGQNYPMSCIANQFFSVIGATGQMPTPSGVTAVYVFDSCLNLIGSWTTGQVISSQQAKVGATHVYAVDNIVLTVSGTAMYVLVEVSFTAPNGATIDAILFFTQVTGTLTTGTVNILGIGIEVPYGSSTLQQVSP